CAGVSQDSFPWERPLGARPPEFRVWAPRAGTVALRLGDRDIPMVEAGYGVHEVVADARAGDDYWFVIDGQPLPDPCSRWQPEGLRGPSRVFTPEPMPSFEPPGVEELVIYELHLGTFTREGTFEATIAHLGALARLGVTAI